MGDLINIFVKSAFVENMILIYFLGMCSYLAVSKSVKTALGLGAAVIFVLGVTAPVNWIIRENLLVEGALSWISPSLENVSLEFLGLIIYIGVIAAMVQLVEMVIEKFSPSLYLSLGIFLPLITVNCSILGGTLFMITKEYNLVESLVFGLGSGFGFFLAIVSLAAIREKIRYSNIPAPLRGLGMAFIITGLMGLAFMGLMGIKL
ncbi:MAG: NADH:ubiquinone reductase (Na(+)-transporting) subunit E [Chitinophagales bacterium]|nr:NADH:ubiquinone reductase (Na(+)-transporting) subunit E [Chitinophagales bacterium]